MKNYFQIIRDIGFADTNYNDAHKYGLLNITIMRSKNTIFDFAWVYKYYDKKKEKLRSLVSVDLLQLRKKVESEELPWVVTDIDKAKQMYDFDKEMRLQRSDLLKESAKKRGDKMRAKKRDKYLNRNKVGVRYVYRSRNHGKWYWKYHQRVNIGNGNYEFIQFTSKTLLGLREKVEKRGLDWDIIDEKKYKKALESDRGV